MSLYFLIYRYGQTVFQRKQPPLNAGQLPKRSIFELAMDNAIEGCIFETYGVLRAHHQANHAQDLEI